MVGVATPNLPNYNTMTAATYKGALDDSHLIAQRIAWAFAPSEYRFGSPDAVTRQIRINAGWLFDGTTRTEIAYQVTSTFTMPTISPRVDLVYIDATTGVIGVVAGGESAGSPSPAIPTLPAGKLPICYVYLTVGMTGITNADITDIRATHLTKVPFSATASLGPTLINGKLVASVSANALTVALKTLAGTDPSATDPVYVVMHDQTPGAGGYEIVSITDAKSIFISSGSTMGAVSAEAFRLWFVLFNDNGTTRLGAVNCKASAGIFALDEGTQESSTAEGGAGAADSAGVIYTGTAATTEPFRIVGYATWSTGLATAGTWNAAPDIVVLFGPGVKKPGDIVQTVFASLTTTATTTSTSFADTGLTVTIGRKSAANPCLVNAQVAAGGSGTIPWMRLVRASTTIGVGTGVSSRTPVSASNVHNFGIGGVTRGLGNTQINWYDAGYDAASLTYKVQWCTNTTDGGTLYLNRNTTDTDASTFPRGVSTIVVQEIMG